MFNRNSNEHKTPKQKADKAVMNIFARLGGCGLLIYFIVQLLSMPKEDLPDGAAATIMAIVLLVLSAVVIGFTVMDLIRGLKESRFKSSTYEDAEIAEYLAGKETASSANDSEDAQQELDAHTNDEAESTSENKDSDDQ